MGMLINRNLTKWISYGQIEESGKGKIGHITGSKIVLFYLDKQITRWIVSIGL